MISKEDIGRRVLVDEIEYKDNHFYNLKGTVKDYFKGGSSLAVEFDDKYALFHDCGGKCKEGHGLYVREDLVTFIDEEKESYDKKAAYYCAGGIESLDVIKAKLTKEQYKGWLLGNIIKYSNRANWKDVFERDIEKIAFYSNCLTALNKGGDDE